MAHCNTILSQILKLVPRHEFEALANRHHSGRAFRTASAYSGRNWTPIPEQTGHGFRLKLDTDSGANWTRIPV
jgi:hypothetical protein